MKQILVCIGLMIGMAFQTQQQEKEATLRLNKAEMEAVWSIIDDAPVAGQIRKPLLQKIEIAYRVAFTQLSKPDSLKKN